MSADESLPSDPRPVARIAAPADLAALYERLSYSILCHAGLGGLAATTEDEYRASVEKYGNAFKALMGADAVRELIERTNLDELSVQLVHLRHAQPRLGVGWRRLGDDHLFGGTQFH